MNRIEHVNRVISQISHLYKTNHIIRRESAGICKELENVIDDSDIIAAGFLANFHKLLIKPDDTIDSSVKQLRIYGFKQNITMPILLLKYVERHDPIAQLIKKDNIWYEKSRAIYNTQLILQRNQTSFNNSSEWHKYLSEVSNALYRSIYG